VSNNEQVIYVECGTTLLTEFTTGIQRVVKSILDELVVIGPDLNVRIIPVTFTGKDIVSIEPALATPQCIGRLASSLKKLDKILLFSPITKSYRLFRRVNNRARTRAGAKNYQSIFYKKIDKISDVDLPPILLLLDSSWYMDLFPLLDEFKKQGGKISSVLYDLIPFTHPETVEEKTKMAHTDWWLKAPEYVDSVVCISKTVREQFIDWQESQNLSKKIPLQNISYFYLGANFGQEGGESHFLSKLLRSEAPFYTMIGSIEPRKNHNLVLDAFEILWSEGIMVRLVIVGRHGWHSDDFIRRMESHQEYSVNLFYFKDACDVTLIALYAKTQAVIMASMAEGFGLPIVEALRYGTKVICNDIPVFREVVNEIAEVQFFDENSSHALLNVLRNDVPIIEKTNHKKELLHWISWEESATQLLKSIKDTI
jgi:glycosyltransferase involved in cell wall biosynthesis